MKLSVVIPAHNEEGSLQATVAALVDLLEKERIPNEIVIVNDNSSDATPQLCQRLAATYSNVRWVDNTPPNGFGFAVRRGLNEFRGDAVAIMMADSSDD